MKLNIQEPGICDYYCSFIDKITIYFLNFRFASEFGYQSYPSMATLSKALKKEHLGK